MDSADPTDSTVSIRVLSGRLRVLRNAGVTHLKRRSETQSQMASSKVTGEKPDVDQQEDRPLPLSAVSSNQRTTVTAESRLLDAPIRDSGMTFKERTEALNVVERKVARCRKCTDLVENRTQTVFGVGNVQPRLVFFGEGPGADEDRQGEPFVGRAGQLLTKIIEACTLKREDVYIMNVVKCRPPGNRNPESDEIANCRPFFEQQLEILQPEFICCLGAVAATTLLDTKLSIGKLRGKFHDYRGIKVLATYHPAYLLRNPNAKKYVWDDMKILMAEMDIQLD